MVESPVIAIPACGLPGMCLRLRVIPRRVRNSRPIVAAQAQCGAVAPSWLNTKLGGPGNARGYSLRMGGVTPRQKAPSTPPFRAFSERGKGRGGACLPGAAAGRGVGPAALPGRFVPE